MKFKVRDTRPAVILDRFSVNAHRAAAAKERGDKTIKFSGRMKVIPLLESDIENNYGLQKLASLG